MNKNVEPIPVRPQRLETLFQLPFTTDIQRDQQARVELPGERVPETEAPQDVLSLVEAWRGRRVGQWVQALYRDERAQRPTSKSPAILAPGATPAS